MIHIKNVLSCNYSQKTSQTLKQSFTSHWPKRPQGLMSDMIKWEVHHLCDLNERTTNITYWFLSHNELLNLLHLWNMVFIGLELSLTNSLIDADQCLPGYVLPIIHTWNTGEELSHYTSHSKGVDFILLSKRLPLLWLSYTLQKISEVMWNVE